MANQDSALNAKVDPLGGEQWKLRDLALDAPQANLAETEKLQRYQREIVRLSDEIWEKNLVIEELRNNFSSREAQFGKLNRELTALQKRFDDRERTSNCLLEESQRQIAKMANMGLEKDSEIKRINRELAKAHSETAEIRQSLERQNCKIDIDARTMEELRQELKSNRQDWHSAEAAAEKRINAIEKAKLEQDAVYLQRESALHQEIHNLTAECARRQEIENGLKASVGEISAELEQAKQFVERLKEELRVSLKNSEETQGRQNYEIELARQRLEISKYELERARERERLAQVALMESNAKAKLFETNAQREIQDLNLQISSHVKHIADFELETQSRVESLEAKAKTDLDYAQAQVIQKSQELDQERALLKSTIQENTDLKMKLVERQETEVSEAKALKDLSVRLQNREQQLNKYAADLVKEKADLIRCTKQLAGQLKAAHMMHPLKDLLAMTDFELSKLELQLKKTPTLSSDRPQLEMCLNQMFEQREFLKVIVAASKQQLDEQAAELFKIVQGSAATGKLSRG